MKTFADRIIAFNESLELTDPLPDGIRVMNPFRQAGSPVQEIARKFYRKYYDDQEKRHLILAINPGRFGAGVTGIPFTDTKRLREVCGIDIPVPSTHEPSSVFVYRMIRAYGGVERFYRDFYIASVCPLGFVRTNDLGKEVNYNYYDSPDLERAVKPFIMQSLKKQLDLNLHTDICICWGKGKNYRFLEKLNRENSFFSRILVLEHPRFIMQYRARQINSYIEKYLVAFRTLTGQVIISS